MKTNSLIQLFNQHKVVIPPIQRDYALGRMTGKIPHLRERFLNAIKNVLTDDKLPVMELDFVYGYIEKDRSNAGEISVFKPLDGQQRLTTLFLIHWYFANKEGKMEVAKKTLKNFSYATRKSSRSFCEKLIDFTPQFESDSVDEQIINQPWFLSTWKSDPTILSMLVVLKDIEDKFGGLVNVWEKLIGDSPRIVFHLLPMDDLGLPDDLYIKMNARGKGLTDFEHFKSQFSEILDGENANIFNEKIDKDWSDLFWCIFKDKQSDDIAKEVDNGFLSFFWYITNILVGKNKLILKSIYWLDIIKEVYHKSPANIKLLFDSLNLFERLEKEQPNYFDEIFYINSEDFEVTKTRIFFNNPQTNLFKKCSESYGFDEKTNTFSVGEQLLLYAFIISSLNEEGLDKTKFRFLRNIFYSSEDQLRNEYLATFLYDDIDTIISKNEYSTNSKFSKRQFNEETVKNQLIVSNPELKETIYRLEDHTLLRGNIAIFDFNTNLPQYADKFHELFFPGCNYFEISKAILTLGDYTESSGKYKRFGNHNNSVWREILTQSESRKGFEKTKTILKSYLDLFITDSSASNQSLIDSFFNHFENTPLAPKDLIYYYIKYKSFSLWDENPTDGFYYWDDLQNKPYECWMLFKTQFNGRHWNPFLLQLNEINDCCSLENLGNNMQFTYGDLILIVTGLNNGFQFSAKDEYSLTIISNFISNKMLNEDGVLEIIQNENGLDLEDRIIKCDDFIQKIIAKIDCVDLI